VPGEVSLWPKLTGGEVIDLFSRLRGDVDERRRDDLIRRFELDPTKRARTYSKGNKQKVALVAALASAAELLILDEPTAGLDPIMEAVFQACVQEMREEGRTVLLSSHILAEVEALCDRVSIIRAGRTVESGALSSLRQLTRTAVTAEIRQLPEGLTTMPGVHEFEVQGTTVHFHVDSAHLESVIRRLVEAGLHSLTCTPPTLEEMFLRHYGDELAEDLRQGAAPAER
jgi:ABC-2 type transport system ATP-binding protein